MRGIGFKIYLRGVLEKMAFFKKGNDCFFKIFPLYYMGLIFGFYGSKCFKVYIFLHLPDILVAMQLSESDLK